MANISAIKLPDNTTYDIKDSISGYATEDQVATKANLVIAYVDPNIADNTSTTLYKDIWCEEAYTYNDIWYNDKVRETDDYYYRLMFIGFTDGDGDADFHLYVISFKNWNFTLYQVDGLSSFYAYMWIAGWSGNAVFTYHALGNTISYNDLNNKPTIPTKTSDLTNDSGFVTTDNKVLQETVSNDASYPVLLGYQVGVTNTTSKVHKSFSNFSFNPSTGSLKANKFNGLTLNSLATGFNISGGDTSKTLTINESYTLAGACAKAVDNSISTSSSSSNLPTSAAVASFVEGKGYITSYTETDPVFSASAAAGITSSDISNWNSKTSNTGTVTSINLISGTGITVSNSNTAITTSGSRTITLNTIKTSKSSSGLGGAQVWKSWESGANITPPATIGSYVSTFTVQDSTTVANRYYSVEATYDGHLIVNVPWEDKTWNGVTLAKQQGYSTVDYYVPYFSGLDTSVASLVKITTTPTGHRIPKYDSSAYLYSTTPSANDNSTKVATTAYVDSAITALPEPMIFKGSLGTGGTITSLPTAAASNEGYTYKVITAGTYASQEAKIGDTFISDGSSWILIPSGDEPSGTVTSVGISNATDGGLSISGSPITSSGSITVGHSNVLTSAQTTSGIYPIKIDKNGHISEYGSAVSIPSKTSDLTNDSGYITSSAIPALLSGTTSTVTPTQVKNALANNQNIEITHTDSTYGTFTFYDFILCPSTSQYPVIAASAILVYNDDWMIAELSGWTSDNSWHTYVTTIAKESDLPDLSNYVQNHYSDSVNSYILPWTYEGAGYIQYRVSYSDNTESSANIAYGVDAQRNSWIGLDADNVKFTGAIELQSRNDYNNSISLTIPTLSSNVTLTLPNTTGTLALTSNIPTKTSDLTNDSGFVTTDEKVKTDLIPSTSTTYYLTLSSSESSQTSTLLKASELSAYYNSGSMFKLILGKDNIAGRIRLYSTGTKYAELGINGSLTSNRTIYLPDKAGTVALTSDIPPIPLIPTDLSDLNNDLNVSDFPNDAGYITGYTETDPIFTASAAYGISASDITNWNGKSNFSGNYNDLTNKPTIPVVPTNISAFTNDSGYITSYTETDPIFSNSAASGILSSDITNWNSKQAALVSGTNIKTINSQSLLGSGDITTQTIYASTVAPTSADGIDGDVWFIYTPSA